MNLLRRRSRDERGASLVEFALILPLFMMLLLGMITGGIAYNQQLQVTHAAREGARYGATLAENQDFDPPSTTWAQAVRNVIVERSAGDLEPNGVCVALVEGAGNGSPVGANWTTDGASGNCFGSGAVTDCQQASGSSFTGKRVNICAARDGRLDLLFFSIEPRLTSSATARYEG